MSFENTVWETNGITAIASMGLVFIYLHLHWAKVLGRRFPISLGSTKGIYTR